LAERINFISPDPAAITPLADGRAMRVLEQFGFDIEGILTLCGGIPSVDMIVHEFAINYVSDTTVRCTLATNLYTTIRRINFDIRVVFNELLEVDRTMQGGGLGTRIICNQVREGRRRGFRRLDVLAMAPDGNAEWSGYYTWGRLGFQMDQEDHEDLMVMLAYIGRPETCLWDLLDSATGRNLWMRDGFAWHGSFLLQDGSQSLHWLKKYLLDKKKDYEI
jgi:hypothetical protein